MSRGLHTEALDAYEKSGYSEKVTLLEKEIREIEANKQLKVLEALKLEKKYREAFELISNLAINFPDILNWNDEKQNIEPLIEISNYYRQALDEIKSGNLKQAQELLVKVISVNAEFEDAANYLCLAVTGNDSKKLRDTLDIITSEYQAAIKNINH